MDSSPLRRLVPLLVLLLGLVAPATASQDPAPSDGQNHFYVVNRDTDGRG